MDDEYDFLDELNLPKIEILCDTLVVERGKLKTTFKIIDDKYVKFKEEII